MRSRVAWALTAARTTVPDTKAESALWSQGWYRHAHRVPSPHFGPRPGNHPTDLIVLHSISLPPGQYGGPDIEALFTDRLDFDAHPYYQQIRGLQVSAHFLIRRGGELIQFVGCDDRAWHAGVSSYRGRDSCNDDSIGIELEGLEGQTFEPAQYETLSALCAAVGQQYPIEHIAGHEHVAPERKKDPGPGFDWRLLRQSLSWPDRYFPQIGA
jgi:AmpD protein